MGNALYLLQCSIEEFQQCSIIVEGRDVHVGQYIWLGHKGRRTQFKFNLPQSKIALLSDALPSDILRQRVVKVKQVNVSAQHLYWETVDFYNSVVPLTLSRVSGLMLGQVVSDLL